MKFIAIFLAIASLSLSFNHENLVPQTIKTPKGKIIKFKWIHDSVILQWNQKDKLQTLDYNFRHNDTMIRNPRFIAENKDYIILKTEYAGQQFSIWKGYFLPLYPEGKAHIIENYFAYDLNNHYVVSQSCNERLEILNLKTDKKQHFIINRCESAFLGYCFDTIYFRDKTLYYKLTKSIDKLAELQAVKIDI